MRPALKFTVADSQSAHQNWKATCGPHAIAAACGLSLEEVRGAIENYRGWMNPTQVSNTLRNLKRSFTLQSQLKTQKLCEGINRIQWEGPWLKPGRPATEAYRHTHYVAHIQGMVLCTACLAAEWIPVDEWRKHHLETEPASPFHVTHHWRLSPHFP